MLVSTVALGKSLRSKVSLWDTVYAMAAETMQLAANLLFQDRIADVVG